MKTYKTVLLAFMIAYVTLIHAAFGQQSPQDTKSDRAQDAASQTRDSDQDIEAARSVSRQDVENAMLKLQIAQNKETLEMMNVRNAFWIQVLQTVMPIVSAIGIGLVGWLQVKAARERHAMAQSINGMKTELVAVTRAAAFLEGAQLQAEKDVIGDPSVVVLRGQELAKAAQDAGVEAHRLAALAAGEKGAAPAAPTVAINVETINLKPGETASAEATKGGGTSVTKDA